jgi:hypothetical protein
MTSPLQHPDALVVTKSSERSWPVRARFSRRGTCKNETMWSNIEKCEVLRSCEVRIFSHYDLEENGYSPDSFMLGNKTRGILLHLAWVSDILWGLLSGQAILTLLVLEDAGSQHSTARNLMKSGPPVDIQDFKASPHSTRNVRWETSRPWISCATRKAMSQKWVVQAVPNWRWPFLPPELYENPARSSKPSITEESTSHG